MPGLFLATQEGGHSSLPKHFPSAPSSTSDGWLGPGAAVLGDIGFTEPQGQILTKPTQGTVCSPPFDGAA